MIHVCSMGRSRSVSSSHSHVDSGEAKLRELQTVLGDDSPLITSFVRFVAKSLYNRSEMGSSRCAVQCSGRGGGCTVFWLL
jgi:hypothetical protein